MDAGWPEPGLYDYLWGEPEFMPPERIDPKEFGLEYWIPTRKADIYAFGLTIFQVINEHHSYQSSPFTLFRLLQARRHFGM